MNWLKRIWQKLRGTDRGAREYDDATHTIQSALGNPEVATLLASLGLPATAQDAAALAAGTIAGSRGLTDAEKALLEAYAARQIQGSQIIGSGGGGR